MWYGSFGETNRKLQMNTLKHAIVIQIIMLTNLLLFTNQVLSQSLQIAGSVMEKGSNKPVEFASIALLKLPDSIKVSLKASDESGKFAFAKPANGVYIIKVIAVSYNGAKSLPFQVSGSAVSIPAILMSSTIKQLNEVRIKSNIPMVNYKADRTVIDVERMNTAGDNVLDVLSKAPGLKLDKDDNLIFKGKSGVNVMIDGKMSYMPGAELTTYLKSLPGSVLSKIELISNPPASFDAAGTAGIINIQLKRNKLQGTNGNVNLGAGYGKYAKGNAGVNLNYNFGRWSSYMRLNIAEYNSYNRLTLNRRIDNEQYNQLNYWHPKGQSYNFSTGADYYIDDRNTVGFLYKGFINPENTITTSQSTNYDAQGQKAGAVDMLNPQQNHSGNNAVNFNYRFKIDTLGRELNMDADYVHYNNTKDEHFTNTYLSANDLPLGSPIDLRNNGAGSIDIYAFKVDYIHPLGKTLKIEAGLKSSFVRASNDLRFDSLKTAGWITDPGRTNLFSYKENINAAYTSLDKSFKALDIKLGLRAEQTLGKGNSSGTGTKIDRSYIKLFPSIFATWKANPDMQLNASYSRRINRPSYSSLNPFSFYSDPYTTIKGNELLQPSYSNSYELNYTYKNFRILNLSYAKVNGVEANVIYQDNASKMSVTIPENLNQSTSIYLSTGSPFNVTKWWNTNNELSAGYDKIESSIQGGDYNTGRWTWTVSSDNNITLPNKYTVSLYGFYSAPSVSGLYQVRANYQVNVGMKKTFASDKAVISFKLTDVFDSSKFRSIMRYNNVNTYWQNEWESRKFSVNLSYKFGNLKLKTARSRKTGTSEEEGRVGQ
jgi:outer membrane receptor protein involved in Fe transport